MAKMDQRQKGILLLTIAALAFLGWQVYSLVSDDLARKPAVANPLSSAAPAPTANATATPAPAAAIAAQQADPKAQAPTEEQQLPPELIKSLNFPARPEYLNLASQYEMAKMQRQLLEEQVAIANAQAQISKLAINGTASAAPMSDTNTSQGGLELVFISEKAGHWTATIKDNGNYQFVVVGTKLPPNMEIIAIDNEGVLFAQESARKKLTFNGMIILPKAVNPAQNAVKNAEQKIIRVS